MRWVQNQISFEKHQEQLGVKCTALENLKA